MAKANRIASEKDSVFLQRFKELVGETAKQQEIADKIGTTRQNVGNWLRGNTTPDSVQLDKISRAYNVSMNWLIGISEFKSTDIKDEKLGDYLGLPEETLNALKSISCKDAFNTLVQSEHFGKLLSCLEFLRMHSKAISFYDDPQTLEEIAKEQRIAVFSREFEDKSDLERFRASETLFRILDIFDFRTSNSEKYETIKKNVKEIDKKYDKIFLSELSEENKTSE